MAVVRLCAKDYAEKYNIPLKTLRRLCRLGKIPCIKIGEWDRTMLMLNLIESVKIRSAILKWDRTMLMLNISGYSSFTLATTKWDRTMLMLNRSKINILFLHYSLYILIFQSLIEILPANFSFLPILLNAWFHRLFTFSAGKFFKLFQYRLELSSLYYFHVQLYI